jgi:cytochrome bd ubiquinol oxidase subunit I
MDVLTLSRLQFAVATIFHFLFVPLTLGLSLLIAIMESKYVKTGDEDYRRMARFWGKLFLINFAIGIVTGITLEFQFGTNWAAYSRYVGDIFGSLLAIEATAAFFFESVFIAVWAFGWNRLSPKAHAVTIWLIAIASNLSAVWILIANSWMQHPVGYVIRNGRAELADFMAVVTQPFAILTIAHTVTAAFILSGFFVMGVSAWHLLRKHETSLFLKSFRIALIFALVFSFLEIAEGHIHGLEIVKAQPAKAAAMDSHWTTMKGAPMILLIVPDEKNERNRIEIGKIPRMLSMVSGNSFDAEVKGLNSFPKEDRPPVLIPFVSFRLMVGLAFLFAFLTAIGFLWRKNIEGKTTYLRVMVLAIPLPYIACELGWMLSEVGRQPWIVYGMMRTKDAVSNIPASNVLMSLIAFIALYGFLAIVNFYLLIKNAARGPEPALPASAKTPEEV